MTKKRRNGLLGSIWIAMLSVAAAPAGTAATAERWEWLKGTYWYVPNDYLPALASLPSLPTPITLTDQTVYRIDGYSNGYFWGTTAVSYSGGLAEPRSPSCLKLVGSVTPEGRLHLTFTPSDGSGGPTVGIGTMTRLDSDWTMENQMSSPAGDRALLVHWAYMFQCRQWQTCWYSLPGLGVPLPDFLGNCTPSAPGG